MRVRSTLNWSQSKIFLVKIEIQFFHGNCVISLVDIVKSVILLVYLCDNGLWHWSYRTVSHYIVSRLKVTSSEQARTSLC